MWKEDYKTAVSSAAMSNWITYEIVEFAGAHYLTAAAASALAVLASF